MHRATFELHLRDGSHFRDQAFASVLLCLCACVSRYFYDPRVLLEGTTLWHSSGWKWFGRVQRYCESPINPRCTIVCRCMRYVIIFGHLSNFWIRTQTLRTTYLPSQLFPFESIVASDQLRRVGIRPRTWFGSVMAQTSGLRRDPSRSDSEQLSHWRIRFRFAIS